MAESTREERRKELMEAPREDITRMYWEVTRKTLRIGEKLTTLVDAILDYEFGTDEGS